MKNSYINDEVEIIKRQNEYKSAFNLADEESDSESIEDNIVNEISENNNNDNDKNNNENELYKCALCGYKYIL